jgi:tight adherence protein C
VTATSLPMAVVIAAVLVGVAFLLLGTAVVSARDPVRRSARQNLALPLAGTATLVPPELRVERVGAIDAVAAALARVAPGGLAASIRTKIDAAGLSGTMSADRVLLAKVGAALAVLLLGAAAVLGEATPQTLLVLFLGPVLAFNLPDLRLGSKAQERRKAILLELSDTLDLMTVMVEAGVAFEAAIARTARGSAGPLAEELLRMMQEMQAGVPRQEALQRLSERCDVPDLSSFVASVSQADRFGVPVARVLRVQSAELREKRRQRAEEMAMKIPTKVILPLVIFILPAMMILVVGPAVVSLVRGFAAFS